MDNHKKETEKLHMNVHSVTKQLSDLQKGHALWNRSDEKSESHSPNVSLGDILYTTTTEYDEALDPLQTLSYVEDETKLENVIEIKNLTLDETLIVTSRPIFDESITKSELIDEIGKRHGASSNVDKTEVMIVSNDAVASSNSTAESSDYIANATDDLISDLMSSESSYKMV